MNERKLAEIQAWQDQLDAQVMNAAAGTKGPAAEIERAQRLLEKGVITQDEFNTIKTNAIAGMGVNTAPVYPEYNYNSAAPPPGGYPTMVVETTTVSVSAPPAAQVASAASPAAAEQEPKITEVDEAPASEAGAAAGAPQKADSMAAPERVSQC